MQPWVVAGLALTFLGLAAGRVGRVRLPRGGIALGGGIVAAALAATSPAVIDVDVIALLAGLIVLAHLAGTTGATVVVERITRMGPRVALAVSLLIVAIASAAVLNDAAVVVLVPLLLPRLVARGVPAAPAVALLGAAANVGSVLTPFGNPQNVVLARLAGLGVVDFLVVQGPWFVAGMLLLWLQVVRIRPGVPVATAAVAVAAPAAPGATTRDKVTTGAERRPDRSDRVPTEAWLGGTAVLLFLVLAIGRPWFGVPLGVAALAAAAWLYAALRLRRGATVDREAVRALDLNVLALFVGLYLLTGSLRVGSAGLLESAGWPLATAAVVVASNTIGNVPAVLALGAVAPAWTVAHASFLVAVSTLGGSLLLTGSAATLLAAEQARRVGHELRFWTYARWCWPLAPLVVLAAWATWPG